ncbi:GON-4-like protein isoform X3 [Gadus macrocephalus]|uniref:GON-4-like protein isoform X3 n=1 Tax=Gadus macrocephalus TaxID=80720 RepID=UPI0028CB6742|nr:GON-4-like protein isoform X3 [Gadus macrocephalus]
MAIRAWNPRKHALDAGDACPVVSKVLKKDGMQCVSAGCDDADLSEDDSVALSVPLSCCDDSECSDHEFIQLDIDLERKSKRHNLTSCNVRAILHEVVTNEHVVAMMKAAIQETQDLPLFEPKMTRSRLKLVVAQGESAPNWKSSPGKRDKPPQFVDIILEDEEDSSDEEYCPDEDEEEEETAEETFLSDADSMGSSPRVSRTPRQQETTERAVGQSQVSRCSKHLRLSAGPCGSQLHIPDCSFLERLDAVEEELALNTSCHSYQSLNEEVEEGDEGDGDGGGGAGGDDDAIGLVAFRTRSKRPLRDVPLGQLEAELLAPDITADMYTPGPPLYKEDRHWSHWLQGLMASDNEEEADDEDDPEYNFLADLREPDQEDYRTDRAVRITKKEVNELLEELFDTFKEELVVEEAPSQTVAKFNVPQALRFEAPLANMLTECRRAVREQFDAQQQRRAVQVTSSRCPGTPTVGRCPGTPNTARNPGTPAVGRCTATPTAPPLLVLQPQLRPARFLNHVQKGHLQQQVQQHVQLLTQVHLLSRCVKALHNESSITKTYLEELQQFSGRAEAAGRRSSFRASNLEEALLLLQEVEEKEKEETPVSPRPSAPTAGRWLPEMSSSINSHVYPYIPADMAWLMATRRLFLHPELLPICSMDPQLHSPRTRTLYTPAEDCLIALGLRNFSGTLDLHQMLSSYLVLKKPWKLRRRVWEMSGAKAPANNPIKVFREGGGLPAMPSACGPTEPGEQRPPVHRETSCMPEWLKKSQPVIQKAVLSSGQASCPSWLPRDTQLRLHPSRSPTVTKQHPSSPPRRLKPKRPFSLARSSRLPPLIMANSQSVGQQPSSAAATASVPDIRPSTVEDTAPSLQGIRPSTVEDTAPSLQDIRPSTVEDTAPSLQGIRPSTVEDTAPSLQDIRPSTVEDTAPSLQDIRPSTVEDTAPSLQGIRPSTVEDTAPSLQGIRPSTVVTTPSLQDIRPSTVVQRDMAPSLQDIRPSTVVQQDMAPSLQDIRPSTVDMAPSLQDIRPSTVVQQDTATSAAHIAPRAVTVSNVLQGGGLLPIRATLHCASTSTGCVGGGGVDEVHIEGAGKEHGVGEEEHGGGGGGGEEANEGGGEEDGGGGGQEEGHAGGGEEGHEGAGEEGNGGGGGAEEHGGGEETGGGDDGQSGGEGDEGADKDGEEDGPGRGEEEDDFDDLTQDEDEEEEMSSEESILSVPELQETMKQLTWLASERRLGGEDSEEDHSPGSQNSQEEISEEEEEGLAKGEEEEAGEHRRSEAAGGGAPGGEGLPRGTGKTLARGRGRIRPPARRRPERHSKDSAKLLLLYDHHLLDNDPQRESKDTAFAQAYLTRVREALGGSPKRMEDFLSLLYEFEEAGEEQGSMVQLYRSLRRVLQDNTELLRDFAAFLQPEQALECGLFEEQQAFQRSRRFLRQLEISFGENPSHYQKIIKALQGGDDLSQSSIHELKAQMASLLKGHTHLQGEFWVFFDELRPPLARPGQFEDAHWPEEGGGALDGIEAIGAGSGGGANDGFEEVTLPELEDEEDGQKIPPMAVRRRRRKMVSCSSYKTSDGVSKTVKNLEPLFPAGDKDRGDDGGGRGREKEGGDKGSEKEGGDKTGGDDEEEDGGDKVSEKEGGDEQGGDKTLGDDEEEGEGENAGDKEVGDNEGGDEEAGDEEGGDEAEAEKEGGDMGGGVGEEAEKEGGDEIGEKEGGEVAVDCEASSSGPAASSWNYIKVGPAAMADEEEEEMEEGENKHSDGERGRADDSPHARPSPSPETAVGAKNMSLTASGEKVILWTREADRVLLTTCQQDGANQSTFQAISNLLGNKTPNQVSRRFRDLMKLFRTAARQADSEEEVPPSELAAANEGEGQE